MKQGRPTAAFWVPMALLVAAGVWFRINGLGKSPLAEDEYYLLAAIRNLLDHGVPAFECGGYYTRGLLLK